MSNLIIGHNIITAPMMEILTTLRSELTNGKLKDMVKKGDDIVVTCPNHKDGHESNPSCFVYCGDSDDVIYGTAHCFTCGEAWSLPKFVSLCFDRDDEEFGKEWLIEHFGALYAEEQALELAPIEFEPSRETYLDESILDCMENYHPYMRARKLSKDVCEKFKVKYDPNTDSLVFPVWDRYGKLKFLTRRSVSEKKFVIDKNADKSNVYLLNYVLKDGYDTCCVCESQIDALTMWGYGIPCVALFGSGTTDEQMEELNRTPIRHWVLVYDGDNAGRKGATRFKERIRQDVLVDDVMMPAGKDINSLTREELFGIIRVYINVNDNE